MFGIGVLVNDKILGQHSSPILMTCSQPFEQFTNSGQGENYGDSADLKKLDIPEKSTIKLLFQGWQSPFCFISYT